VIGFGLLLDLTFPTAASYLAMNQTPAGPNHSLAYGLVNTPREWLLVPLALLLNWHLPRRRRLLLAMVAVLYVERVITYLYFAPTVLSWQETTPAQTTPALLEEVAAGCAWTWPESRSTGCCWPCSSSSSPTRGPDLAPSGSGQDHQSPDAARNAQ
jgi:hypothetical protein